LNVPLLDELRRVLCELCFERDLERCARAMGLSTRSLQRRLKDHRTTFVREVERARVLHAMKLMTETTAPLSWIALEVGFSTPGRLSAAFRHVAGTTPSAWRRGRTDSR
jgi:AraC-like DNA-binding protein